MYFLALLLTAFLPLTAQDTPEQEGEEPVKVEEKAAESSDEVKEEAKKEDEKAEKEEKEASEEAEKEPAAEEKKPEAEEAKAEETPATEEKPVAEEKKAEPEKKEAKAEEKPATEEKKAEPEKKEAKAEKKEEAVADATLKIEDEEDDKDSEGEEKDKDPKKFSVSVSNGFSHGVAKERKSFAYSLSVGASYQLPWKINMNAGIGLSALYRYDLEKAAPLEDGTQSKDKLDYGKFDGTPLNIGFSRAFPLFWDIGSSIGINVALPFTSTELWEQYNIYTMLSVNVGARRAFKIAKETSITFGIGFGYTKTFAKNNYAWDDFQNTMLSPIQEHSLVPGANLSFKYKDFGLAVGASFNIGKLYSSGQFEYPNGETSSTEYQGWQYGFSFRASASYSIKSWNIALGVTTNAPEKESGGYSGYDAVEGDPDVKNPSQNYPFKGKYTRVFANIGYSYSF